MIILFPVNSTDWRVYKSLKDLLNKFKVEFDVNVTFVKDLHPAKGLLDIIKL